MRHSTIPSPTPIPEEAHEAIPAWWLRAPQAKHEDGHQGAGAAREEPPRMRGQQRGTSPERTPHAEAHQAEEAILALVLLAHHPDQE
jgi:hypothetical protein